MSTSRGRAGASRGRAAGRTGRGLVSLAAAALLTLATGCGSEDGSPRSHPTSKTKISADVGEEFTVAVDENPSTGERWYLATPKPDASVVRSTGDDHDADDGSGDPVPGAGGQRVFTFEATGAGSTEIVLLHCPIYTCTGGTESLAPPSPTAFRPAPERITYTVTVS